MTITTANKKMKLEAVIGLETHVQLKTISKLFCPCDNDSDNALPNSNICPICLGRPGTLPVTNIEAIRFAIKAALALNCQINRISKFDRKSYFYPDLPKGYQISQYDLPIGFDGFIEFFVNRELKKVRIERLHMEEDAAKLLHPPHKNYTLVDFNRAGTPLIEIVSRPEMRTPDEAKAYLQALRLIMRYLNISDADMEKGHLRCDANISLRPEGEETLYAKTEIKNVNSFRSVARALEYEVKRQKKLWEEGKPPTDLTTRGWDEVKLKTVEQRRKEEAEDYRYFPEPDLPPMVFQDSKHSHSHLCKEKPKDEINIDCLRAELSELPTAKIIRFMQEYKFSFADAKQLSENLKLANFSEASVSELKEHIKSHTDIEIDEEVEKKLGKLVGGWITSELVKELYAMKKEIDKTEVTPHAFAELLMLLLEKKINSSIAKQTLGKLLKSKKSPKEFLEEEKLSQMEDEEELSEIIKDVIATNEKVVADYKKGKVASLQFLIGQVMKQTKGRANPQITVRLLKKLMK